MTIEAIEKRIAGKKNEIEKLRAKLDRILKAKATGWEVNPYFYDESDELRTSRDLSKAISALGELQETLEAETCKASSRNVPVILEFLEGWKRRVTEHYADTVSKYPDGYKQYREELASTQLTFREECKLRRENPAEYRRYREAKEDIEKRFKEKFGFVDAYLIVKPTEGAAGLEYKLDTEKLKKDLDAEADRKYDFIIARTLEIVEKITDASDLTVSVSGELNGNIVGTAGKANVRTVGAGGYNIQCFHYRTLIRKARTA